MDCTCNKCDKCSKLVSKYYEIDLKVKQEKLNKAKSELKKYKKTKVKDNITKENDIFTVSPQRNNNVEVVVGKVIDC